MNWKKHLNLNSYEWWRNHRKIISYGGGILLFSFYLSPLINQSRIRDVCARHKALELNNSKAARKLGLTDWGSTVANYCSFYD